PVPPDPGPDRSRAPLIADAPSFDRVEVTAATGAGDADRFLDAVFGHDLDAGLQQIGAGMVMALDRHRARAQTPALAVVHRRPSPVTASSPRVCSPSCAGSRARASTSLSTCRCLRPASKAPVRTRAEGTSTSSPETSSTPR